MRDFVFCDCCGVLQVLCKRALLRGTRCCPVKLKEQLGTLLVDSNLQGARHAPKRLLTHVSVCLLAF